MRTSDRRARVLVAVLGASLALLTVVGSVAAAPRPQPVTIDSPMTVSMPTTPNSGTFTASGSDRICASGTVLDTRYVWDLPDHLLVDKTFDCGGGLVDFRLSVHYSADGDETFTWTILGGTDTYAGLHGHGGGTTTTVDGGVVNHYVGFLVH
jgi:hypothetical protein